MSVAIGVVMGQYAELAIRGKVHYHADISVTENGADKDLTGWTSFECELKEKDDEDGTPVMTATVALSGTPAVAPQLTLDLTEAITTAAQAAGVLEGVFDIRGKDTALEYQLIAHGDWRLTKGVTD